MAIPRFAWGIDVGNRALKAIKIVRDGEQFRVDDYDVIEHEQILSQAGDNKESLIQTALANFAQRHSSKGGAVAIGVSGQSSFARFIKLPPVDPSKVAEIVKFEAIQQIPFPLEDVEWSYQLFQAEDNPEVEVGIFAMRRDLVNQTIKHFTDVGLQVNVVQMNPLAVYNGLHYDKRLEGGGAAMIIDVGAENSDLIIAEGENIWMRSIPIGGNNFTEALVKAFQLKFPKAEELKRNAATSKYGRQILQAMKPIFSDLVSEIQRSIGFYSSTHRDSRITKVLALGGTFRLPGLQKYLQQNLQLEVSRIDRLDAPMPEAARFAATFNENILSSIGAYGLAMQAMDQTKIKSSLLPEKIRRERMWREKTRWFALAAALFVAGTAIPVGKLYADRFAYEQKDPIRRAIDSTSSRAKRNNTDWKAIETSGDADRAQISSYIGLLTSRDLNLNLIEEIGHAFPLPDPAELSRPRGERRAVSLVGWSMKYEPNIAGMDKSRDDEFNQMAEKLDLAAGPGAAGSQGGYNGGGYQPGGLNGGNAANAVVSGTPHRGYLLTLLCRTPNVDPTPLISDTVVKVLRSRTQEAANPPKRLSFVRVTIPSKVKLSTAYPQGIVHNKPFPINFVPPAPGTNPLPGGFQPNGVNPGGAFPGVGVLPGSDDAFLDPMIKGESIKDDSLVTVLALVMIDPPAPEKPAGPLKK